MLSSLGYVAVPTPGTPVRATVNAPDPTARVGAQTIYFQAKSDNSGVMYVGTLGMDKTTGVGVVGFIGVPASESIPTFEPSLPTLPAGLNVADYYIDADDADDVCLVSYTQG
jgi:hypothetical protein